MDFFCRNMNVGVLGQEVPHQLNIGEIQYISQNFLYPKGCPTKSQLYFTICDTYFMVYDLTR
jgi:hypothetical protein